MICGPFPGFLQLVSWLQLAHQWGRFSLLLSIKPSSTPLWQEMNEVIWIIYSTTEPIKGPVLAEMGESIGSKWNIVV